MLDVLGTAASAVLVMSFFGFGTLAAAVSGPHRLIVVALVLMVVAASLARPGDLDL